MKQPIQTRRSQRQAVFQGSVLTLALLALGACSSEFEQAPDQHVEAAIESPKAAATPMADTKPMDSASPLTEPAAPISTPTPGTDASEPDAPAAMTSSNDPAPTPQPTAPVPTATTEIATLGAGCFWCIEAVLEQLDGVQSVVSGYTGGETLNPTYSDIGKGQTGHAEVVQVTFDPTVLPYKDLLDWFWKSHDPTTLNRQGADRGTQYRSAIFVHSPAQRKTAETSIKDVAPTFADPIVTEITDAVTFYVAEKYHQGYYFENSSQGYCRAVIAPKLKKLGLKY